jgi:hypothetical protein
MTLEFRHYFDISLRNLIIQFKRRNKVKLTKRYAFSFIMSSLSNSNYLLDIIALFHLHSYWSHLVYNENMNIISEKIEIDWHVWLNMKITKQKIFVFKHPCNDSFSHLLYWWDYSFVFIYFDEISVTLQLDSSRKSVRNISSINVG